MATEPASGAGDVPIELDGQQLVLKPTLEACLAISKLAGGLNVAIQKCSMMDVEVINQIICIGLSATSLKQRQEVEGLVFRTGVMHVAGECVEFIRTVANGGQRPKDDEEGGDSDPLASGSASPSTTTDS